MTLFLILKHLLQCGLKERQLLPMLSIIFTCHLILHCFFVHASTDLDTFVLISSWPYISLVLLFINFFINITGYFYLYKLWNHSITVIFNREIPKTIYGRIPSLAVHLSMLRPLQILFRLMTARFRVLPDIIILGEVRCGTTTFCHHLVHGGDDKIINGCHPPFCLWKHPELDQKETFYFVGHYLGMVSVWSKNNFCVFFSNMHLTTFRSSLTFFLSNVQIGGSIILFNVFSFKDNEMVLYKSFRQAFLHF